MTLQGFFQRSLTRKNPYKCVVDETSDWSQAVKTCSHCRYNRCLQAGMSRDGWTLYVKIYTYICASIYSYLSVTQSRPNERAQTLDSIGITVTHGWSLAD